MKTIVKLNKLLQDLEDRFFDPDDEFRSEVIDKITTAIQDYHIKVMESWKKNQGNVEGSEEK
jgi:hypothetical protein